MVDDFSIACKLEETYTKLCDLLDLNCQVPMSRYGMMKHFNGIDVYQSRTHISISSKTYLDTVFKNYGWKDLAPTSLPMNPSNELVRALDSAEPLDPSEHSRLDNTRFRYHAEIGELIWPMITTRPELSYPVVKLSKFATSPATIHYDAVYGIFQYLSGTRDDGITYTRPEPMTSGPVLKHTPLRSQPSDRIDEHIPTDNLTTLYGYSDADWAMDIRHRRSISGMVFFLAGAVVAWKTRVQPTVVLSTSESELLAASDTGRLGLFIRAVLIELLQPQHSATTVYEDNDACRMVADSTAPTRQMRHIAIRDFALQDWTERNLISLTACASNANASDMFTKQVDNILCARHHDHISGRTTFFRINPDLLHVPRSSSGARGGGSVPASSSRIPATPFDHHSLE
jgi:hypothetical protein